MKKLIVIITVALILVITVPTLAEELPHEYTYGESVTFYDNDGIKMTFTGKHQLLTSDDYAFIEIEAIFENNSGRKIGVMFEDSYVNGWATTAMGFGVIESGKKQKSTIDLTLSTADVYKYEDLKDFEFEMHFYDGDSYETRITSGKTIIHFN